MKLIKNINLFKAVIEYDSLKFKTVEHNKQIGQKKFSN